MLFGLLIATAYAAIGSEVNLDNCQSTGGKVTTKRGTETCACPKGSTPVASGFHQYPKTAVNPVINYCHEVFNQVKCPENYAFVSDIFHTSYCIQCKPETGLANIPHDSLFRDDDFCQACEEGTTPATGTNGESYCEINTETVKKKNCPAGTYFDRHFVVSHKYPHLPITDYRCKKCAPGYGSEPHSVKCTKCSHEEGLFEGKCLSCPLGTELKKGICKKCPSTKVSLGGDNACTKCARGEVPNSTQSGCKVAGMVEEEDRVSEPKDFDS